MRKLSIVLAAALAAFVVGARLPAPGVGSSQAMAADMPTVYPDDMYMGKADAKVTVIEFASLSCPHCAAFNNDVLPKIKADYMDKGLVRWIYRDFPLNRDAFLAAILTHCASPIRYFSLVDSLFRSQSFWETQPDVLVALKQIGASEGVDEKTYDACIDDQALKDKILARYKEAGDKYQVNATPSFLINGKLYAGEMPYEDFKKLLDAALGAS
jgi:protein-disulfide isomerase